MKENLETWTTPELVVIAEANGMDVPCYKNGKPKISKSALIDMMVEEGIEVEAKVEEEGSSEKIVFKRGPKLNMRMKTRRR